MKVDLLESLLASAVLYGVGSYLFWFNKTLITLTADVVFGSFKRQGADAILRIWNKEEEEEEENKAKLATAADAVLRVFEEEEAKLVPAVSSEGQDFKPPPVQVIDDVEKKCD